VSVRQPGKPPQIHPQREIEPLNLRRANPVLIRVAEDRQLFDIDYRGRRIAEENGVRTICGSDD